MADMSFSVSGLKQEKIWKVHRAVMLSRCKKLSTVKDAILNGHSDEYVLNGLDGKGLTADHVDSVLEYVYTDRCPMTRTQPLNFRLRELISSLSTMFLEESIDFVYMLAKALEIPGLVAVCESRMPQKSSKGLSTWKPRTVAEDVKLLLESKFACDISFSDDSDSVDAHRFILASRCPYYNAMWRQGWKEADARQLPLPEQCSMGAFRSFLTFLYTDQLDVSGDDAVDLLALAHEMDLAMLKHACDRFIAEAIDPSTAVPLLQVAATYEANRLRQAALETIDANPDLKKSDDFAALPEDLKSAVRSYRSQPKSKAKAATPASADSSRDLDERKHKLKDSITKALNRCSELNMWTELEILSQFRDRVDAVPSHQTWDQQNAALDAIEKEMSTLGDVFPSAKEDIARAKCAVM
jgi:hypothetical protein